jgi:oxygen-independent coproporphyrinogen III oxidase
MNEIIVEQIPYALIERYGESPDDPTAGVQRGVRVNGVGVDEYAAALASLGNRSGESLALYIHVPFCPVRCHYCACNTNVTHDTAKIDDYLDTLEREMDLVVERIGRGREVRQLHVGGGTPNYLSDLQLARLMEIIEKRFRIQDDGGACIECNPRRASAGQIELLRGLGFGQISLGVQDLSPGVQRAIGRIQSAEVVRDVCQTARDAGFDSISVDLVYGLPEQRENEFARTVEQIISMEPDRVRCSSYAHAPALRPNQFAISSQSIPGPAEKLSLFSRAVSELTSAGYSWIGVDCFARSTDEWSFAQAERRLRRNSIGYTATPSDHVLSFGTYGLGEVENLFVQNEPKLATWRQAVHSGRLPIAWGHRLSDEDSRRRRAYEHLMCNLELPASETVGLEKDLENLRRCADDGLLELGSDGIRVTPRGRFFLRDLCVRYAASLDWESAQWRFPKST